MILLLFTPPTEAQRRDTDVDWLDEGLLFRGAITFERGKETTLFFLERDDWTIGIRLVTDLAFPPRPSVNMSSQWARLLTRPLPIALRLADAHAIPPNVTLAPDKLNNVVWCPKLLPVSRKAVDASYALQCLAHDEHQQSRNDEGPLADITIIVTVPNGSPADRFLSRPRSSYLQARLE